MAARKSGEAIEITRAELDSAVVTAAVERAKEAAQVPLRREVGAADLTKGFNTGAQVFKTAGLAAIGAIAYVIIYEMFFSQSVCYTDECILQLTGTSTAIGTAVMAFLIAALQGFEEESSEKILRLGGIAVLAGLVGGAITGALGQKIYTDMQDSINPNGFDIVRAGAWALQYLAVGVAVGISFKSIQKTINGILGGAIGGFIGGGIFNIIGNATITSDTDTGTIPRLIGFTVVGLLVGGGIGLADAVRKNLWLQIATGGMAGKQFIVYQQNAVLGSSSSADITLIKDPEIAGMHVRLNQKSGGTTFEVLDGASDVLLNGEAARRGKLSDGVLLQVGGTVLQFGEKNVEMPTIAWRGEKNMSDSISIQILDATGTRKQEVEVPDDAQAARLVAKLVEVLELPVAGPDGQPMVYKLHHRASGRQLRDDDTLDAVGVKNGDELRMIPEIIAG